MAPAAQLSSARKASLLAPRPKNGHFYVVLLAGAPTDRARELRDRLAKTRGILVQYHLDYEKPNQFKIDHIPECVDLVIFIKSQLGHSVEGHIKNALKAWERAHNGEKLPYIKTSHKWTALDQALRKRMNISKVESLPLEVISTAYFKAPPPPEPIVVEDGEVEVMPEPTPAPSPYNPPNTATVEVPVSASQARQVSIETFALALQLQKRLIEENAIAMISATELTISSAGSKT